MENLLGIVIFLVLVIASLVKKALDSRNKDVDEPPPIDPEDLPETTRRMLYGPSGVPPGQRARETVDVPVAKPKGVIVPKPVQRTQAPEPPRPAQPAPVPPAQRRIEVQGKQVVETLRDLIERQFVPPTTQAPPQLPRRPAPPKKQAPGRKPGAARQPARAAERGAQRPAAAAQAQMARPGLRGGQRLFANLDDVRRGIILSEVLGTPKGLQ